MPQVALLRRARAPGLRCTGWIGTLVARPLLPCSSSARRGASIGRGPRLPEELAACPRSLRRARTPARIALHVEAFEHRIIDAHVVRLGADECTALRDPRPRCRRRCPARSRLSADTCRRCAPAWWRRSRQSDSARACRRSRRDDAEAAADSRCPGRRSGILVKSSLPRTFWSSKQNGQWSVETTCRWSCLQPVPQLRQILFLAQRRREHVLRAFEIRHAPCRRWRAADTAGTSRRTPAGRDRAPRAPGSERLRTTDARCTSARPQSPPCAMARCTASASARVGRVSA